ncbi:hypothetical protein ABT391_07030 [Streptomyces jumonjinensis]|uniref:hypothetical protein n=1 Tax=Streptomyces jumonjinensis TaxID=1945 RepID=UPI00331747CF
MNPRRPSPTAGLPAQWLTVSPERTVLGVIHNVTSATRLLDLLSAFEGDLRVQTYFTCTDSSPFSGGIAEFCAERELPFIPWAEAEARSFDLAISTSRGGDLHKLSCPVIGSPHGAGYNKRLSREPGAGSREPGAGSREPGAGSREPGAFGLTAEWLVHDGELIPSAIVLSHEEQRERLRDGCPEAVPFSHVVGDPCMDQLHASAPFRDAYREALGVRAGQRLVLLTSTWGGRSLLGGGPAVVRRALAESPREEYRFIAAVHPNVWYGHGGWQLRSWLEPCVRAGLLLPPPATDAWKAAICAADAFVGDHGSLTLYAAAFGVPGLLAAFDTRSVAAGSPMERLGAALPRVSASRSLREQLAEAVERRTGDTGAGAVAGLVTSYPGEALARFRRLCYTTLGLSEPEEPVFPRPVELPAGRRPAHGSPVGEPLLVDTEVSGADGSRVTVRRYPAALQNGSGSHVRDAHLVAEEGEPDARWAGVADVFLARRGVPERLFARYPGCAVVAVPLAGESCAVHLRDGRVFTATWARASWWAGPGVAASAVYAWLSRERTGESRGGAADLLVDSGGAGVSLLVMRRAGEPAADLLGPDAAEPGVVPER